VARYLEISEIGPIISPLLLFESLPHSGLPGLAMKPLRNTLSIALLLVLASVATVSQGTLVKDERELSFYHTHTGKRLNVVYAREGRYVPSALEEINNFLFDFRTGDAAEMDPELLDLIYDVREALGSNGAYQVVSAYRSPKTNEMLRGKSGKSGVAKKSQHLLGKAIDVRLEGVKTAKLRDQAIAMKRGGVGYYEASDFVHMDTGRVRRW